MNRQQRRAAERAGRPISASGVALAEVDAQFRAQSDAMLEHAREIRRSVPYPGETLADSLAMVEQAIEEIRANPMTALVAEAALLELRGLADDLRRRVGVH